MISIGLADAVRQRLRQQVDPESGGAERWADSGSVLGSLRGVTVVSASDAWAVGYTNNSSQTVIAHWNGRTWSRVPSPDPGTSFSQLYGVAASSATNVWAAGTYSSNAPAVTLAVHCC